MIKKVRDKLSEKLEAAKKFFESQAGYDGRFDDLLNDDPNNKEHILRVSSLYKQFGHKKVVRGVEFSMKMGEVLGLLGPNGAGKTTTFYMVVGFYKPTAGDVFLDNHCITQLPMYKRSRLGISYLPQVTLVMKEADSCFPFLKTHKPFWWVFYRPSYLQPSLDVGSLSLFPIGRGDILERLLTAFQSHARVFNIGSRQTVESFSPLHSISSSVRPIFVSSRAFRYISK